MADKILLLDIGTTTVSGALFDCKKRKITSSDSVLNQQAEIADDVISRIGFALDKPQNARILQKKSASSVNKLIDRLCLKERLRPKAIKKVYCVCNSAIHHLFLGINPSPLVNPPYKAAQKSEITVFAGRIGIDLKEDCPITFLPNIGGFVGSDALSIIIASNIYDSNSTKLAVDIGTNGEIVLGNKNKILVASTAAGPAFEGRHISCGMPAKVGAIEAVDKGTRGLKLKVIGRSPAKGICGSGLIDAVSAMIKSKAMDRSGKIKEKEFILYKRGAKKISITQADIRKIQLAKAAIYAAIKTLLRRQGIQESDIKEIAVTGSFGSRLNKESIVKIGLIPDINKKRIKFIKDGPIKGLELYEKDPAMHKRLLTILSKINHIPLLGKGFAEEFTSSLALGPEAFKR